MQLDEPDHAAAGDQIAPIPRITIQAFCETNETASAVNYAASDRRMLKTHVKVHMGGLSAAVEAFRESPTPNLIIIESHGSRQDLIARLGELAEFCDPTSKVIVIGRSNDILLYRELIAQGVSDYLVAPLPVLRLVQAISTLYATKGKSLGRVIAVTGVKGGVGASTLAHNIGFLFARDYQTPTIVADLDVSFGTAALNFNQDSGGGIVDALTAPSFDHARLDSLLIRCGDMLSILPSPATVDRLTDITDVRMDAVMDTLRTTTPIIIADVPHVWSSWAKRCLVTADDVVLVANPDLASLRNARNLIDELKAARPNDSPPHLVLNMTGTPKKMEISEGDFSKAADAPVACSIPFDPKSFGAAANNGQMLSEIADAARVNEVISGLTRVLAGKAEPKVAKKQTLLSPIIDMFNKARAS
jgi:pilus assembly protein CpaE